ncbi:hypothetical protein niasHS_016728 [Heterodera schachtii]|uniref:RING-type domain-containing protein n=1 Tax=Heterodera schachtii TaxID=97005 RepID=A0ABD2HT10_HETSC
MSNTAPNIKAKHLITKNETNSQNAETSDKTASSSSPNNKSEENCSICLGSIANDDNSSLKTLLNCNHGFHQSCIDQWLQIKKLCPVCRGEVNKQDQVGTDHSQHNNGEEDMEEENINNDDDNSLNEIAEESDETDEPLRGIGISQFPLLKEKEENIVLEGRKKSKKGRSKRQVRS